LESESEIEKLKIALIKEKKRFESARSFLEEERKSLAFHKANYYYITNKRGERTIPIDKSPNTPRRSESPSLLEVATALDGSLEIILIL